MTRGYPYNEARLEFNNFSNPLEAFATEFRINYSILLRINYTVLYEIFRHADEIQDPPLEPVSSKK